MKGDIILYENQTKTYMVIGEARWSFLTTRWGMLTCRNCRGLVLPGDFCFTSHRQRARRQKVYCGYCAKRLGIV